MNAPTISDRLVSLEPLAAVPRLPAPVYAPTGGSRNVFFAIESFKRHMTDEGWQLQIGLAHAGYELCGNGFAGSLDVAEEIAASPPSVAIMQDKREWDSRSPACLGRGDEFRNYHVLAQRPDIFKLTILKDAHANPPYHAQAAAEIGCHGWITYYHTRIVSHLAPYVRPEHVVRTYHSLDRGLVPPFEARREGCIVSGAVNTKVYPFRSRVLQQARRLPQTTVLRHPGYHARGWCTPDYLKEISRYKVAVCTCSIYGYALRKIIESVACGLIVITDLPPDDPLPYIDDALVRVSPEIGEPELRAIIAHQLATYDADRQQHFAELAKQHYDWRVMGVRLAERIEELRTSYTHTG